MPYPCDVHDDRRASVTITNMENGDVASLCGEECLPAWSIAMAAMFTADPDDPGPLTTDGAENGQVDGATGLTEAEAEAAAQANLDQAEQAADLVERAPQAVAGGPL